jgi:hypothetical protein
VYIRDRANDDDDDDDVYRVRPRAFKVRGVDEGGPDSERPLEYKTTPIVRDTVQTWDRPRYQGSTDFRIPTLIMDFCLF